MWLRWQGTYTTSLPPSVTCLSVAAWLNFTPSYTRFHTRPSSFSANLHEGVRVVSGDLEGVLAGLQQAGPELVVLLAGFGGHHGAHRAGAQHLRDDGAAVREIRADARGALPPQHAAQEPSDAPRLVHGRRGVQHGTQADRLAEFHEHVAAIDEHGEELAGARGQRPVLGEQQAQPGSFLLRRAAPVDRRGDEQDVAQRISAQFLDQVQQVRRRAARHARVPETPAAADVEK